MSGVPLSPQVSDLGAIHPPLLSHLGDTVAGSRLFVDDAEVLPPGGASDLQTEVAGLAADRRPLPRGDAPSEGVDPGVGLAKGDQTGSYGRASVGADDGSSTVLSRANQEVAAVSGASSPVLDPEQFYRDVLWALREHAMRKGSTAQGAAVVVKRIAKAHGLEVADRLPLPRLSRSQLEERGLSRSGYRNVEP